MSSCTKVLSHYNGDLDSQVVFVAEAPGRLGADIYGIPLYGDQTGKNFDELILAAGINRNSIFITNAILCNPRNSNGNNDTPNFSELRNCADHLRETLEVIKPKFIISLGSVALKSLQIIHNHDIKLSENVGMLHSWNGYHVFPLYHPGPRARIWRNKDAQIKDYKTLVSFIL